MLIKLPKITEGYTTIVEETDRVANMLMDVGIEKIGAGKSKTFVDMEKETALLLLSGKAEFHIGGEVYPVERNSLFDEAPYAIHTCKGTELSVYATEEAEFIVQKAENGNQFDFVFYRPEDCRNQVFGDGMWNDAAKRICRTVFDLSNAPYSKLVLGELINFSGRWSSYIPHGHDQPEVYYYRFAHEAGFGAAFIGDEAYKIVDNSALFIPGGPTHPQVTAPGFPMWYCWMIRHLDNNPWDKRVNDPQYEWLLEKDVKIWPEK